jgi:hypothetical protein
MLRTGSSMNSKTKKPIQIPRNSLINSYATTQLPPTPSRKPSASRGYSPTQTKGPLERVRKSICAYP